ncbi:Predicted oxidoreductase, contains short-chain dehydrogenase (SDR) and DUF2520 domains [Tessaracoccus bendigoensis DSM 12906]|uniref:Predicted oxidoreductase, contains short-chain dehydrogenase (SDR) and DUF2520 domains n=1 Tax=Tessaracoccus bendigoensis DSM 12906 TaxID=1123357 RepID=A0A1M6J2D8_9ACTN|nr:Rossmann-like and DUF2520 domain-containing protein [Tessaracoccus bendigoensis]SHJ40761.1 Predicted oxidoreductase, contains short-chain dehydrogenase (SDR) and DUF2520 domains [Tessaracoccus bendigoensis DSM 12906]
MPERRQSRCIAVVGNGRLGKALCVLLRAHGWDVQGPFGRGADPEQADVVLLCVPDSQIAAAAANVTTRNGLLVGHCSGATTLAPLAPHDAFGMHPLMTVPDKGTPVFDGVTAAIAGTTSEALETATDLALSLGMSPVEIDDAARPAYHAAASVASNFLLTLEDLAERLAASAGMPRERLVPLVRATVENWAQHGAATALTGPIARGDRATVAAQRLSVAQECPDDLELFDALVAATGRLSEKGRSS